MELVQNVFRHESSTRVNLRLQHCVLHSEANIGFELQTYSVISKCSANCATATGLFNFSSSSQTQLLLHQS